MDDEPRAGLFDGLRRLPSDALDAVVHRVATSDQLGGAVDEVLASALPSALDQLDDHRDDLIALVDNLLPELLPRVMDRLKDDPEQLVKVVDALLPQLLPMVLDRLKDDPQALVGLVDALLPELLPIVLQRLSDDPDALLGMLDAILPEVLDRALPVALGKLNENPDPVRDLIWGQSSSFAGDLAVTFRSRLLLLDDRVDGLVRRLTFRKPLPITVERALVDDEDDATDDAEVAP